MANTFITPQIVAREALMVLRNNAVLANLVHRDYSSEFVAGVGDTVTIRKPAKFEAKEFSATTEAQAVTESKVDVKLDKLLDVTIDVTAKEMTLRIEDFSQQILTPAMQAFADKIDKYIIALADAISTNKVTAAGESVTVADVVDARAFLTKNAAPLTERRFVYNTSVESALLKTDLFVNASAVGDAGTALREASLGRKFGMDFYVDQNMDTASTAHAVAFHKNAFALVTRMLELPQGAAKAAIMNYDGFAIRVVYGYDMSKKTDTISLDMLCGVKTLDENLAAIIAVGG